MPESLLNKVEGLRPTTLLKKETLAQVFPVNFAKFLRTPFFIVEHLRWLLLHAKSCLKRLSNDKYFENLQSAS